MAKSYCHWCHWCVREGSCLSFYDGLQQSQSYANINDFSKSSFKCPLKNYLGALTDYRGQLSLCWLMRFQLPAVYLALEAFTSEVVISQLTPLYHRFKINSPRFYSALKHCTINCDRLRADWLRFLCTKGNNFIHHPEFNHSCQSTV